MEKGGEVARGAGEHTVGLRVDGARRCKGARGVQEETEEAWAGPRDTH